MKKTVKANKSNAKSTGSALSNLTSAVKATQNKKVVASKKKATKSKKTTLLSKVEVLKASQGALDINEIVDVKKTSNNKGKHLSLPLCRGFQSTIPLLD